MAHILIVEDDINLGQVIFQELKRHNHEVELVENAEAALVRVNKYIYDIMLTDLKLPGIDGIELLKRVKAINQTTIVLVMTGYASVDTAVVAMKNGAQDFIQKPFGLHELVQKIDDALSIKRMKNEIDYLRHAQEDIIYRTSDIIGVSSALKKVLKMVEKVAKADSTLLITGETGVGKGLIAGAIHHNSGRSANNFVQVNCAALPQNILESELFGHEKGAFTGAVRTRIGRVEQANMGTIFLDEIGDMDIGLQSKILRVLEDREFERVGGERTIKVDVRVITATNQDLYTLVERNRFREDLFYRISVVELETTPLRERKIDIDYLTDYLIEKISNRLKVKVAGISNKARIALRSYDFPGNVRELENILERAINFVEDEGLIEVHHLTPMIKSIMIKNDIYKEPVPHFSSLAEAVSFAEETAIRKALKNANGNRTEAAKSLNIHRSLLYKKIIKYNIAEKGERRY